MAEAVEGVVVEAVAVEAEVEAEAEAVVAVVEEVDISCLPREIDIQNLNSFTDEQWYGFNHQQRQTIWALRNMQNNHGHSNDDVSLLGQGSAPGGTNTRQVYQLVQMPAMPPAPTNDAAPQPPTQQQNDGSTRSTNAGSAFGR